MSFDRRKKIITIIMFKVYIPFKRISLFNPQCRACIRSFHKCFTPQQPHTECRNCCILFCSMCPPTTKTTQPTPPPPTSPSFPPTLVITNSVQNSHLKFPVTGLICKCDSSKCEDEQRKLSDNTERRQTHATSKYTHTHTHTKIC